MYLGGSLKKAFKKIPVNNSCICYGPWMLTQQCVGIMVDHMVHGWPGCNATGTDTIWNPFSFYVRSCHPSKYQCRQYTRTKYEVVRKVSDILVIVSQLIWNRTWKCTESTKIWSDVWKYFGFLCSKKVSCRLWPFCYTFRMLVVLSLAETINFR